jgi:hypothetical protein
VEISKIIIKQQTRGVPAETPKEDISPSDFTSYQGHDFGRKHVAKHDEINRVLSVGMATMSDHLRLYKDPFEPG